MNLLKNLPFNNEKPDKINVLAIGLKKDQVLSEHKTGLPTLLTVVRGSIDFKIQEEVIHLEELDTFQIPVNKLHEAVGKEEENVFTLTQEKE